MKYNRKPFPCRWSYCEAVGQGVCLPDPQGGDFHSCESCEMIQHPREKDEEDLAELITIKRLSEKYEEAKAERIKSNLFNVDLDGHSPKVDLIELPQPTPTQETNETPEEYVEFVYVEDRPDRKYVEKHGAIEYVELNEIATVGNDGEFRDLENSLTGQYDMEYLYKSGDKYKNRSKRMPKIRQYNFEMKLMDLYGESIVRIYPYSDEKAKVKTVRYYIPTQGHLMTDYFKIGELSTYHTHIYDCVGEVCSWIKKKGGVV